MIINTDFIGSEKKSFCFQEHPRFFSEIVGMIDEGRFEAISDVRADIAAKKIKDVIELRGQVALKTKMYCSRCLERYALDLSDFFELSFFKADVVKMGLKEEIELSAADLDKEYYSGNEIDIAKYIQDQLIIALPITPLCSTTCKGLCPDCGVNLNTDQCTCQKATGHPAFSVLKNLKVNDT